MLLLDVLIDNLPEQQLIYTKQSKLKVVKLIQLNNNAASCKDIVRCSIRRNSADRYAYENIASQTKITHTHNLKNALLHRCEEVEEECPQARFCGV